MKQQRLFNPIAACVGIALAAAPVVHGQISFLPITGDTDCEIDSVKVYTHAVDFGTGNPRALINGVQFQEGGTTFGTISGTSATVGTGTTTVPTAHAGDGSADPYLNGASPCNMENLVRDMNYNDATAEITLTGLTPGQPYRFRLYNRVWGTAAASRPQNIGFDTDGVGTSITEAEDTTTFNEDNATDPAPSFANWWQVNACTYDYTLAAGVTQLKVYINATGGGTYHLYGLTNEVAGPDETPPVIATTNPADDSTGAYPGTSLVATFSEEIALTGSGTITLTDLTDGSDSRTISLPNGQVTVSGADLTIDPSANLELGTEYEVTINGSAIQDTAETPNAYPGTAAGAWTFTTAAQDPTAPVITDMSPADDAVEVASSANLVATFDDLILAGAGNITLVDTTDGTSTQIISVTDPTQVSITGNVLTIDPAANLEGATVYAVQMDAGVVKNFSEVGNLAITDTTTWNFTSDATPPSLVSLSPLDEASDVFVAESFVLEFGEPVAAGTGNILVKNLTDATTTTVSAADTRQVFIYPTGVVIDLLGNLAGSKNYAIQIEPNAFTDLIGNPYLGITDDTTWNFTTVNPKTLFSDDFESPDVTIAQSGSTGNGGTSKIADTTKWVRATQGYGAAANGIEDEGAGRFTDPVGEQAYRFCYTNSGVTTAPGVIGNLMLGATYTISFNVVEDGSGGLPWGCKLVAFNAGARRDDVRSDAGTTVLRTVGGSAPSGGAYQAESFTFTANSVTHAASLGKDLAIRFIGGSTSANIDNVVVSVAGETIAPTLVAIEDNVAGGPVTVPNPVVYTVTFAEPMDASTIGTDDFENGVTSGAAGITVGSVSATADPAVYQVTVTTASAGDLMLQIKSGAVLTDANGNALDTGVAIPDDTTILVEVGSGAPYGTWAAGPWSGTLSNDAPDLDFDRGGLETGIEWVVGGDPTDPGDDAGLAPTFDNSDPNNFVFIFTRRDAAEADANTTIAVEYGSDLSGWTTAQHNVDGVSINDTTDLGGGFHQVTVAIPKSLAVGSKLFARLSVAVTTP